MERLLLSSVCFHAPAAMISVVKWKNGGTVVFIE